MIVTGIEAVTKKKSKVELDSQLAFVLYKGELARYCIALGQELEESQYEEIMNEVLLKRAKRYLIHLLTKMDRTTHELKSKLYKGFYPQVVVEKAIAYVASYNYIDDERYAKKYLQAYEGRLSLRQIKWKLQAKGIAKEIIDNLDDMISDNNEHELIQSHIAKRTKGIVNIDRKEIKRLADYLYRKGFESSAIWEALEKYNP